MIEAARQDDGPIQRVELPGWTRPFWRPARYKIAYGGRGSGKSYAFARMLLILAAQKPLRVLCARELQNSIADSVHQLLSDQIQAMGLEGYFDIKEKAITSAIGSRFMFKGLRGTRNDASQLKSLEGVDICWIEEGQTVSKASLETLKPTIRKPGSEIWITFNPDQETDPVYQLATDPPDGAVVEKVNWSDNPWFPPSLDEERRHMLRTDPDLYQHVWEGECRQVTDAQILKGKWSVEQFDDPDWRERYADGPYYGADWGFAQDPTTLVRSYIIGDVLYISHEAWAVGCEIEDTPDLFRSVPGSEEHMIRADSSRPEMISYLSRKGFRIVAADKWSGSVETGISYLRAFSKIVIHERCRHTIDEARRYSYKVDRLTGDVLTVVIDAHNHCIDAIRYAHAPMIKKSMRKKSGVAGKINNRWKTL